MARIFTTPEKEQAARAFMHDVMVAAGIRNTQRINSRVHFVYQAAATACREICDELINRNFKDIDNSIYQLAGNSFQVPVVDGGSWKRFNQEAVAKAIVYMAELLNIYWDDTNITPYEIDEFKKTKLGDAVYKYGRYISAIKDPKAAKSTASRTTTTRATSAGGGAVNTGSGSSSTSGKPVGPQSGNIRDLRDINGNPGTPGVKVVASDSYMCKIVGDKTGKNTPNAFINPLSRSGAVGTTNKVKFSSGNGWTDCTCLFDNIQDAQNFLAKLLQNNPDAVAANARIEKLRVDPNGYFLVGTEYGICAISAKKMNEALTEASKLTEESGECWERATKNYSKEELEELHTWMRKD